MILISLKLFGPCVYVCVCIQNSNFLCLFVCLWCVCMYDSHISEAFWTVRVCMRTYFFIHAFVSKASLNRGLSSYIPLRPSHEKVSNPRYPLLSGGLTGAN